MPRTSGLGSSGTDPTAWSSLRFRPGFGGTARAVRSLLCLATVAALALLPSSTKLPAWQIYTFDNGSFHGPEAAPAPVGTLAELLPGGIRETPVHWRVTASALADVTGDGIREWVLLVWRPWRDWPIQRWLRALSPIAGFHDATGESCHLILLDPQDGREIWAGSALPKPLLALAGGDVDGDGRNEVVTLEGNYTAGREGPAAHVNVWRWNRFGFTLAWRSPPGRFHQLSLTDTNNSGILDIAVR